ncbi:MAG: amidohydrolase family protein [Planctomycetota bacterium]|jgi:hypothetical protein
MIPLIDIQSGFGGLQTGNTDVSTAADLKNEMEKLEIEKSVARVTPDFLDFDVIRSNRKLYQANSEYPDILPCPVMVPNTCKELEDEEVQVSEAIDHNSAAVVIRPKPDYWILEDYVCDKMFKVLESRKMPVMCYEKLISLSETGRLAGKYNDLPLIICGVGYRDLRTIVPMLQTFKNTYLSIGNTFCGHKILENFVNLVGVEKLLFGTGYPGSEAMTAVTQLTYCALSEEQKTLIGSGNFKRLQSEVV